MDATTPAAPDDRVPTRVVAVMAIACGTVVANIYYNQPLLGEMQRSLGTSAAAIGLVPTATQLGYAVGLLFLVPLGDHHERVRLFSLLTFASAAACVAVALAPDVRALIASSLALGAVSVVGPGMTAYAATLAAPSQRGQIVGTVMTGLLFGVLLSRTLGGALGSAFGWRAVFWIGAVAMVLQALVIETMLPRQRLESALRYGALLRSLGTLLVEEPGLRLSAWLGAMAFGAFSAFWATLALFLERPPLAASAAIAGAFGVVGAAGALAAPIVGRLADRGHARAVQLGSFVVGIASFGIFALGRKSLVGIGVGVLVMDLAVQASHITNLSRVYALRADARSRLNTVYMLGYFLGGATGSALGVAALARWGWLGVCGVGAGMLALGLLAQLLAPGASEVRASRARQAADAPRVEEGSSA